MENTVVLDMLDIEKIKFIIESVLFTSSMPLSIEDLQDIFDSEKPSKKDITQALTELTNDYKNRSIDLKQLASGFQFQAKHDYAKWILRLADERPVKYSRALLETLALIAYRQPITRAEISDIRGVLVNSQIIKTLIDRNWVKIVGHKNIPGRPELFATTNQLLDDLGLKTIEELPKLDCCKTEKIEIII